MKKNTLRFLISCSIISLSASQMLSIEKQIATLPSPLKVLPMPNPENEDEDAVYDKTMIISEDFSGFTQGLVGSPAEELVDGWVDASLTKTAGWSARCVKQAGGVALIDLHENVNANLCTPIIEIPLNDKPVVVTFRGMLGDEEYHHDWAQVHMVDPSNPSRPITFTNDYAYSYNHWVDYKFVLDKKRTSKEFYFQFSGYDAPLYIDDIEIKFLDPKVQPPVATAFSDFSSKGFTANWQPVEDAEAYLVNLFTITYDQDKKRTYLVKDLHVNGTSHAFTDVDASSTTLYYTVRALKGDIKSPESNPIKVNGLDTPVGITMTPTENGTIKLSWDAVPGADYYEIIADRDFTASEDCTYVLSDENFDGIVSTGTFLRPEELMSPYEELDEYLTQPGWISQNPVHINGAYGLVGYYYQQYGDLVYLESPTFDLSANDGKVSVSVDLYGAYINELDDVSAVVRLLQYVSEEETKVLSKFSTPEIPSEWTHFDIELPNGAPNTAVEICARAGYLFIDNIRITQELSAGDHINVPYVSLKSDTNEIEIPVYDYLAGNNLSVKLRAVKEYWDSEGFSVDEFVRSPYSDNHSFMVDNPSSIKDNAYIQQHFGAVLRDNLLTVSNPTGSPVEVYDITGCLLASDRSGQSKVFIPLSSKGIIIVRVGEKTIKLHN